jgi:arylsulfatase A-like enzyme
MSDRLLDVRRPFCAFLITLANHHPFTDFPDELRLLDLSSIEDEKIRGYLHSVRWSDEAVGDLLAKLDETGLADSTVVAVWGDHDSGLFRNRKQCKAIGLDWSRPTMDLYSRVPVFIRVPGDGAPTGTIPFPTGLSDLPPTLAALLGIDPAPLPWFGRNLLGDPEDEPVLWGIKGWVDRRHVLRLWDEPVCYEISTSTEVDFQECAATDETARRLIRANAIVLQADLQQRLRETLEARHAARGASHD